MLRVLAALGLWLLGCSVALAQSNSTPSASQPPFTGATISANGYNFAAQGALFAPTSSPLQFSAPFSVAFWIKTTALRAGIFNFVTDRPSGNASGFTSSSNTTFSGNNPFIFLINPSSSGCENVAGASCTLIDWVNDGNWHSVCHTVSATNAYTYIDGIARSQSFKPFAYLPSSNFWTVGSSNSSISLRDVWVWNIQRTAADCSQLYVMGLAGITPNSGLLDFSGNVVAHWTLDASTSSSCASGTCYSDAGPNNIPLTTDSVGPTVAITSPTAGTDSGSINLQGTCSDAVGCSAVFWLFDGVQVGTSATAPYTVALNTANYADGVHVVSMIGRNGGGGQTTATPVSITTSNSVSNKTVFISSTGSDSNNCTSTGTACATFQKANSLSYHGGDSVLVDVAHPPSISSVTVGATNSTALVLAGPGAVLGGTSETAITQNVRGTGSGWPLTVSTYNGSGSCVPLAGLTTNCATITLTGNSIPLQVGMINVINLSYVTVQNFKIVGTGQSQANTQGNGIDYLSDSGLNGVGVLIQNNEVIDFFAEVWVAPTSNYTGYPNFGEPCGITVQDNYLHGSSQVVIGNGLGVFALNTVSCTASAFGTSVLSNYTNNTGGISSLGGTGIVFLNATTNAIDNFNVTSNGGGNGTSCGGPYGNWIYQTQGVTMKGNEAFNFAPASGTGGSCDYGDFDIDKDNENITLEYNYGHNSWGPSLTAIAPADDMAVTPTGNFTVRYNIFENGAAISTSLVNILGMVGAQWDGTFPSFIYNNVMWNGFNGTSPYFGIPVLSTAFSPVTFYGAGSCPTIGTIVANNIMVANGGGTVNANMVSYNPFGGGNCNANLTYRNNAYFPLNGATPAWISVNGGPLGGPPNGPGPTPGTTYFTLAGWQAGVNETGSIQANPNFAGAGGQNVTCWTLGTGAPVQPGSIKCPSNYQLTNPGSGLFLGTGVDLTQAPYSLSLGTADYYTNTIPNGGAGTGYNIGADGAHH